MTVGESAMLKSAFINSLIFIACILILSACASSAKQDYAAMVDREQAQVRKWSTFDDGQMVTIIGGLMDSPELKSLVDEALEANPGLQQTLLTLKIRQAEYRQTNGQKWPEVSAAFTASREKDVGDDVFKGSATVSWELDFWRKLEDDSLAALKDVAQQEMLYQSARDTLASEVMINWLSLTAAQKNIRIEQQQLKTLEKTESFIIACSWASAAVKAITRTNTFKVFLYFDFMFHSFYGSGKTSSNTQLQLQRLLRQTGGLQKQNEPVYSY